MNIYIEIFGYIGTALVIISMLMTSVTKLRTINLCGSVISATYAAITNAWPIFVMNVCLIIINGFHLIRQYTRKNNLFLILSQKNDPLLLNFLEKNHHHLKKLLPNYALFNKNNYYLIYNDNEIIGILIGNKNNNSFDIDLFYLQPKHRHLNVFPILSKNNIYELSSHSKTTNYNNYLKKIGFTYKDNILFKSIN